MRGEDIGQRVAGFDSFLQQAHCPSIAIGDGGNEIGMGNVADSLTPLNIIPSVTRCSELVIADVSNWGALGIIALLGWLRQRDLLASLDPLALFEHLSRHGSVDGVTRANTLTEDGLPASEGLALIRQLRTLTGFL